MDSYQSSLYESLNRHSSASSMMNSASGSSSRILSPSLSSSVSGRQGSQAALSPLGANGLAGDLGGSTVSDDSQPPPFPQQPQAGYPAGYAQYAQYGSFPQFNQFGQLSGAQQYAGASIPQFGSQYVPHEYENHGLYGGMNGGGPVGGVAATGGFGVSGGVGSGMAGSAGASRTSSVAGGVNTDADTRSPSVIGSYAGTSPLNTAVPIAGLAGAGASVAADGGDEVVPPALLFWHYIDSNEQDQGPFDGPQMQEWMSFFEDVMEFRRHSDQFWVSLAALKRVLGTDSPFVAQLTEKAWAELMKRAQAEDAGPSEQNPAVQAAQTAFLNAEAQKDAADDHGASHGASDAAPRAAPSESDAAASLAQLSVDEKPRKAEPAEVPALDPWKKTVRGTAQTKISDLKQQALDGQKKHAARKVSQGRWMPVEPVAPEAPVAPESPQATTWGKRTVTPAKSIADVQREQKEQQAQQKRAAASTPAANGKQPHEPTNGRFAALEEQRSPKTNVKPTPAKPTAPLKPATAAAKPTTLKPRTARTQQPLGSVTARANSASPADELVHWVRVSFKDLVKGVDSMELLDVFLSLGNGKSAKEFIAESVYEYSKSLDGRKFASDFLARKQAAEAAMGANETWKDVLARFNPNVAVEHDPSFKVVSKKRTHKIVRPGDGF